MKENNKSLGWIINKDPDFFEKNGYNKTYPTNYHYFGCICAKANNYPVYKKQLYINYDYEEESEIEIFPCEIGSVIHNYIIAIYTWNNSGGTKFGLDIVKQISTINQFNDLVMEYIGDDLEDGSYLLNIKV